ncbi:low-density lipoprotein receptor-related protein 2-like [Planococcus citri]|uniref:low-density lipoprotein receptor-related protein 2-like n=1 Tax=Planococcus citri TaxID=170843 RepID=UPI0031F98145
MHLMSTMNSYSCHTVSSVFMRKLRWLIIKIMIGASVGKVVFFVWLISEVGIEAFRCKDERLLNDYSFCNGAYDCEDRSDETYGCDRDSCGAGKFRCNASTCIDVRFRCDLKGDCRDGSDEINCGNLTTEDNCVTRNGKYLCRDKSRCIEFKYACDGTCHCDDCSDENKDNCTRYANSGLCLSCKDFCLPTPNGPECTCDSITYESSRLCRGFSDCTGLSTSNACDQFCGEYRSKVECFCNKNYLLRDDGQTCQSRVSNDNILVYSTATKIKARIGYYYSEQVLKNDVNCTALSAAHDFVLFATFNSKKGQGRIVKTSIRAAKPDEIIKSGSYVTSIAVDWITNNTYFTSNESLSVCASNGQICARIGICNVDYVALAPEFGWMYFSQQVDHIDERLIIRSNMDGSDRNILTDGSYKFPLSLAVDEIVEMVYWYETKSDMLHSVSFFGTKKKTWHLLDSHEYPYFTFKAFEGYVYFTLNHDDKIYKSWWKTGSIYRNQADQVHTDESTTVVRHIYPYNPLLQRAEKASNPCALASCDGLCLLSRSSTTLGLTHSCVCEHFKSLVSPFSDV